MMYKGVIIEQSLMDTSILKDINIIQTEEETVTTEHKTPWVDKWTMHTFEIDNDMAEFIANKLSVSLDKDHAWYADFSNESYHYIIFYKKIFRINRAESSEYDDVVKYGISLSIPVYQLDFSSQIPEWKRDN